MNGWLIAAAAASFLVALTHIFAGTKPIVGPLLRVEGLNHVSRFTNYYCWHIVSILLLAMAAGFAYAALRPAVPLAVMMTFFAGAFMVWSVGLILWKRLRPFHMPQWALFLPVTAFGILGLV